MKFKVISLYTYGKVNNFNELIENMEELTLLLHYSVVVIQKYYNNDIMFTNFSILITTPL